ncbi:MAG: 4-amino-4-deoxy-L-arabinose transferase-like glycosyltransferase, partial [Myxococcota bacterium]
ASAAALLIKGPPVLILIGGMGGLLFLVHPHRRRLLLPLLGMPLAALPLVAWGWWAWGVDGGESIRWMLDFYILDRASGGTALGQTGPPGFYLLTMLLLLFPWSWKLPGALVGMVKDRGAEATLLAAWMAAGWWFYELIPSKLPLYALGAYPALALAMARFEGPVWARKLGGGLAVLVGLALAAGLIGLAVVEGALGIAIPGVVLAVLGVVAWKRPGVRYALAPVTLALIWLVALPGLRPKLFLTADVAQAAIETGHPVVIAENYRLPSLPYYLSAAGVDWRMQDGVPPDGETLITTDPVDPPPHAIALDGLIPDKGRPVRFWVIAP